MSFGQVGYRDGQRTVQQDASSLAWSESASFNAQTQSPVIPTQGFSHTLFYVNLSAGGALVQAAHYLDAALGTLLGTQVWVVDSLVSAPFLVAIPNLSGYVQLTANVLLGKANYTGDIRAQLTNKSQPPKGLLPFTLWTGSGTTIAISGSRTEYLIAYHGGAVQLLTIAGSQATTFTLQAEDSTGVWRNIYLTSQAALTTVNSGPIVIPFAPVRLVIGNQSGAATDAGWQASLSWDPTGD